ncbi:o-succinylbenzoate synthase [soil metagenome]
MKLAGFDIYRYTLPFTEPVTLKGVQPHSRKGILLELRDDAGASGLGEASPLPGFSRESLDDAEYQLYELASSLVGSSLPADSHLPECPLTRELDERELAPSVRFGFELAVYNIYAASQGKALQGVLSEDPGESVALNGLLIGSGERVLDEARRMREAGYEAVKLKVGARDVREDVDLVGAVADVLGDDVALRLDANRAWSFEEAVNFLRDTSDLRYEYIEEPLAEPAGLSRLVDEYGARVALDESLVGMKPEDLLEHRYARAVVLKPTLLGGISRALRLGRVAGRIGAAPVISSAYETGVGTSALISLAAVIGGGRIPAGLDTYRRLAADVYEPALDLSAPSVSVKQISGSRGLDRSRLEHIYSSEARVGHG